MTERFALWTVFTAVAVAVGAFDATPMRIAEAITDPSKAATLAAAVSAGGALIVGLLAAAAVWAVRSAFAPEEVIRGASLYDEVTAEQEAADDTVVAEAERILRDHRRRP